MKSRNIIIGIGILLALIFVSVVGWIISNESDIILQGQVEAKQIKVSSKIPGRISHILVKPGSKVLKNDILIQIETPELDAKKSQAEAAKNAAKSQSLKAENGAREEQIEGAFRLWKKAEVGVNVMEKTMNRVKRLYDEGVIPEQKLDETMAQYNAAIETEKAAKSQYDMANKGARFEDKLGASALVDQALGVIQELDSYLSEADVKAPIDGEISSIISQEGELINTGFPVITIVDLTDIWLTFNVREDFLSKFKMDQIFQVSVPALGGENIEVKVNFINPLGEYANWKATKTSGDFDLRTFEVQASPTKPVDGLRAGMSVLVNLNQMNL